MSSPSSRVADRVRELIGRSLEGIAQVFGPPKLQPIPIPIPTSGERPRRR